MKHLKPGGKSAELLSCSFSGLSIPPLAAVSLMSVPQISSLQHAAFASVLTRPLINCSDVPFNVLVSKTLTDKAPVR